MSIWTWLFPPLEKKHTGFLINSPDVLNDLLYGGGIDGDIAIDFKTAIQSSAVLCCARVIAEGLAQVPCKVFREDALGSPVEARDHPLYNLLRRKPNDWQTSFELREQIGLHLVLTNNAFIYKNIVAGRVTELYAFQPSSVQVTQNSDYSLSYKITGLQGEIPPENIWHIRGPSWNGYTGLDAVALARKTIGLAHATEKFGTKLFENSARPGGVLTTKTGAQPLTAEQREQIKKLWQENYQGTDNAHKTALLPFDLEFTPIAGTATDAQWIENRKFLIQEICRFFRVLPIMVMQAEDSTSYNSVEQLFQAHLTHTLMPWYERFEQSADTALFTDDELAQGYSIRLCANALLRGSTAERADYYMTMRQIGAMTANEVRLKEDLPRSPDPEADKLIPAANIFGGPASSPEPNDNEVSK